MSKEIKTIASTYQKDPFYVEIPHETLTVSAIKQYYVEISESKKIPLAWEEQQFLLLLFYL